jgi:hypothetical protein
MYSNVSFFFKSALIFRNTYDKGDAVLVFICLERGEFDRSLSYHDLYLTKPVTQKPQPNKTPSPSLTTDYLLIRTSPVLLQEPARGDQGTITRDLQKAIRQSTVPSDGVSLLAGRWQGPNSHNFVLTFAGSPPMEAIFRLRKVLTDPFPPCLLAPQKGSVRVLLNGVPTIRDENGDLPSEQDLRRELESNPVCSGITFLAAPRWLKKDIDFFARHSSVLLSLVDPDGKTVPSLIRSPPALFGQQTTAQRFEARPTLQQCNRCWALGHQAVRCRVPENKTICPRCGGPHALEQHANLCPNLHSHKEPSICHCESTCLNCTRSKRKSGKGPSLVGHSALDVSCPLRAAYRLPTPSDREEAPSSPAPAASRTLPETAPVSAISRPRPIPIFHDVNPVDASNFPAHVLSLASRPDGPSHSELASLSPEEQRWLKFERAAARRQCL